jgi:hypothetical protein
MVVGKQEVAMAFGNVFRFTATVILSLILGGCGLSGVRGTVLSADENRYLIRDYNGTSWTVHRDDVRVFMGKDGYAAYIQKLEQ